MVVAAQKIRANFPRVQNGDNMYKIGLSTKGKVLNEELFRQYSLAGIQAMELALSQNELEELDFCELKAISDKY